MGGNVFKNLKTVRLDASEIEEVKDSIFDALDDYLILDFVRYYNNKESFGDLDVIVRDEDEHTLKIIQRTFANPSRNNISINGDVISVAIPHGDKYFQVDFIKTPPEIYNMACDYYAYNDLGNLIGRMSKKLGFKIGHKGLAYIVRDDKDQKIGEVTFSTSYKDALELLGLSYDRFRQGFDDLEDIFMFVASSPYFNKNLYLLENRSRRERIRDVKRHTYAKFLEWCEENSSWLPEYPYEYYSDLGGYGCDQNKIDSYVRFLFHRFPNLKAEVGDSIIKKHNLNKEFKQYVNGKIVSRLSGISEGKELGKIMQKLNEKFSSDHAKRVIIGCYNPASCAWDDFLSRHIQKIQQKLKEEK